MYDSTSHIDAKVSSVINGNMWNWPIAWSDVLVEIQSLLFDQSPNMATEDKVIWIPSKTGSYQTEITWNKLRVHAQAVPWYHFV